jgi:hypothetical protein
MINSAVSKLHNNKNKHKVKASKKLIANGFGLSPKLKVYHQLLVEATQQLLLERLSLFSVDISTKEKTLDLSI